MRCFDLHTGTASCSDELAVALDGVVIETVRVADHFVDDDLDHLYQLLDAFECEVLFGDVEDFGGTVFGDADDFISVEKVIESRRGRIYVLPEIRIVAHCGELCGGFFSVDIKDDVVGASFADHQNTALDVSLLLKRVCTCFPSIHTLTEYVPDALW